VCGSETLRSSTPTEPADIHCADKPPCVRTNTPSHYAGNTTPHERYYSASVVPRMHTHPTTNIMQSPSCPTRPAAASCTLCKTLDKGLLLLSQLAYQHKPHFHTAGQERHCRSINHMIQTLCNPAAPTRAQPLHRWTAPVDCVAWSEGCATLLQADIP